MPRLAWLTDSGREVAEVEVAERDRPRSWSERFSVDGNGLSNGFDDARREEERERQAIAEAEQKNADDARAREGRRRPWAITASSASGFVRVALPGYRYATKEAAEAALARMESEPDADFSFRKNVLGYTNFQVEDWTAP